MKEFLDGGTGLLAEIGYDVEIFMSVKVDTIAGTASWNNGVDFDPFVLYSKGKNLDKLLSLS
ncbi:hypothetical protein [Paenibacillus tyrfis]|uniref:hypothetical protein n=1 Tax=Paenibacillus tyrfis TaxID=1501230 RepID=UPI001269A634|nr:hypothetical protein [Paenibacillus tyrfis]